MERRPDPLRRHLRAHADDRPLAGAGRRIEELAAARDMTVDVLEPGDRVGVDVTPRRPDQKADWRD